MTSNYRTRLLQEAVENCLDATQQMDVWVAKHDRKETDIFGGCWKMFRCKTRKYDGMRRTYWYAAMTEDAAQRSRWTFCDSLQAHS